MRSNRRERLRQLREQIAKREKPLIIRRRMFGPCQGCGADDQAAGRVYDEPCSTCGFVNVRAVRRQDAVAPPGPTPTPSSTAEAMRRRCEACAAVVAPEAKFCAFCGVRHEVQS